MTYRADTGEEMRTSRIMPGPQDYKNRQDQSRLNRQHLDIRNLMLDGGWRTVKEISDKLSYPETSVSAQLRHLRKPEFGGWEVSRRRRKDSQVSEYQVLLPVKKQDSQKEMFSLGQISGYQNFGG